MGNVGAVFLFEWKRALTLPRMAWWAVLAAFPVFGGGIRRLLKIRDKLVVIIQSEMGRTPNYNNGNGKDHWSIGSIMFLGPGIAGNRVIGATDEKQLLVPINPKTLKPNTRPMTLVATPPRYGSVFSNFAASKSRQR